jgi:hypothetical protein
LKLQYETLLSTVAFNFSLRRYSLVVVGDPNTLSSDRLVWGRWLDWATEAGPYPSIFSCFEMKPPLNRLNSVYRFSR